METEYLFVELCSDYLVIFWYCKYTCVPVVRRVVGKLSVLCFRVAVILNPNIKNKQYRMGIDVSCQFQNTQSTILTIVEICLLFFSLLPMPPNWYWLKHGCYLSSLRVKCCSIICHDVFNICHLLSPHKKIAPATFPDCGKINMFQTTSKYKH